MGVAENEPRYCQVDGVAYSTATGYGVMRLKQIIRAVDSADGESLTSTTQSLTVRHNNFCTLSKETLYKMTLLEHYGADAQLNGYTEKII